MRQIKVPKPRFERVPVAEVLKRVLPGPSTAEARSNGRVRAKNVIKSSPHKVHPYSVSTPDALFEE